MHLIAVVMREVFQGAASRVVRGMCSVVLEAMVFSLSSDLVDLAIQMGHVAVCRRMDVAFKLRLLQ